MGCQDKALTTIWYSLSIPGEDFGQGPDMLYIGRQGHHMMLRQHLGDDTPCLRASKL